ncbi:MAG: cysteine peptidase family C39 domain-containing protein [Patescibacteria group bacterium]
MGIERIKPYEQRFKFSCGPSSLLIAYQSLGVEYDEARLVTEIGTDITGTSWEEMLLHPLRMGLKAELRGNSTWNELKRDFRRGVLIVGWSVNFPDTPSEHFSVVRDITDDLIELADPGIPIKDQPNIMEKEEFLVKWQGEVDKRIYLLIRRPK